MMYNDTMTLWGSHSIAIYSYHIAIAGYIVNNISMYITSWILSYIASLLPINNRHIMHYKLFKG